MIGSLLRRFTGFSGILALAWSVSVGMLVAHVLHKLGAPGAVRIVGGGAVGFVWFLASSFWLTALTWGAGMSAIFGNISKIGLVVSLFLTAVSIAFTSGILHWVDVTAFGYWYMIIDWNVTVFLIVNMAFTAIKGGFKGAVAVVEELVHEGEPPKKD